MEFLFNSACWWIGGKERISQGKSEGYTSDPSVCQGQWVSLTEMIFQFAGCKGGKDDFPDSPGYRDKSARGAVPFLS